MPEIGELWYNNRTGQHYIYDGANWVESHDFTNTFAYIGSTATSAVLSNEYVQGRREEQIKYEEERKLAEKKAKALLTSKLDKKQLSDFKEKESFVVTGSNGGRYLITKGISGNVCAITKRGKEKARYCFHPVGDLPVYDVMLSQKLMLETKEKEAIEVANKY